MLFLHPTDGLTGMAWAKCNQITIPRGSANIDLRARTDGAECGPLLSGGMGVNRDERVV